MRTLLPSFPENAVVAVDECGRPLGAAWWFLHDPPLMVDSGGGSVPAMTIAVKETQRRHGIGTALIEALVAEVAKGFDRLALNVHLSTQQSTSTCGRAFRSQVGDEVEAARAAQSGRVRRPPVERALE